MLLEKDNKFSLLNKSGFWITILLTSAGFILAVLENVFFPQISDKVVFQQYSVGTASIDINQAFRIFLLFLILLYTIIGIYSYSDAEKRKKYVSRLNFRFALGIVLGIWDLTGTKLLLLPQPFFPGPAGIIEAFLAEGDFIFENMLYSLRLYIFGFSFGTILGVGTGILIGWFKAADYWISPVMNITGVIPAVAWMPFALTLFPEPFSAAVFLIVICAWFPIASLTALGIKSIPKAQFEAARTLGGKTWFLLLYIAIPHAMPNIFTGIKTANAFAFTTLVMAEMLGQPGGLGYYINISKVWSAYYKVFAAIIVMAVLFTIITKIISIIENYVLRWQRGLVK